MRNWPNCNPPVIICNMTYDFVGSPLYQLLLDGKQFTLPKGQVVNALDDVAMLNLLKSGYIKRYLITNDGSQSIQVIYGPNEIFPLTPVYQTIYKMDIYRGPELYYYEAMTEIQICSISQDRLQSATDEDPMIYKDLLYAAGVRLNSYIHRLESVSLRIANRKVAYQLIYLADKFGQKTPEGTTIMMPLTHQTLADVLNLARETVTHCISHLQDKKIIRTEHNKMVLDIDALKHVVR